MHNSKQKLSLTRQNIHMCCITQLNAFIRTSLSYHHDIIQIFILVCFFLRLFFLNRTKNECQTAFIVSSATYLSIHFDSFLIDQGTHARPHSQTRAFVLKSNHQARRNNNNTPNNAHILSTRARAYIFGTCKEKLS
jgi:hypothetical protein